MRKSNSFSHFLPALFIITLFIWQNSCYFLMRKQIPITTSSSEALEYFKEGRESFENLRTSESIPYFKKALELDPNFAMAYYYLAMAYRYTGSSTGFYSNLEKAVALVDKYLAFAHPHIGDTRDFYGNLRKAVSLVDKVSEGEKYIILSLEASIEGNLEKEREYYKKLIELYPQSQRAHFMLGDYYFNQSEYKLAVEELRKAIEIDPEFAPAYNMLGYAQTYIGNYDDAEEIFRKYAKLIPGEPNPYDSWAELLMRMGKIDESIEVYKKALTVDSTFYYSYHGLGMNYVLKDEWGKARDVFRNFYNTAPSDVEKRQALFLLMCSYIDEGKFDMAKEYLRRRKKIAEENNDWVEIHRDLVMMGDILIEEGNYNEALSKFRESVELLKDKEIPEDIKDDSRRSLLYYEALINFHRDNLDEAASILDKFSKKAIEENNRRDIQISHSLKGRILYKRKEFDKAVEELKKSDMNNPQNRYWLGLAYREQGDTEKAVELLRKTVNFYRVNYNYWFVRNKAKAALSKL